MLQGCLSALRAQPWGMSAGGALYQMAVRTARRKHLRIASRRKRELENKLKAKEKVLEKKFVPFKVRMMQKLGPKVRLDDLLAERFKDPPEDDVWLQKYYLKRVCTLAEALQFHREAFHPSVLNAPESPVHLNIELNMKKEKTSFMEKASGIVLLPHTDNDTVKRSVVACGKTPEDQAKARDAGAEMVGAHDVVSAIEKGELKMENVSYLVCHTDFIMDLLKLRGVLAKKFPDKKKGTLGTDMTTMVRTFAKGIEFESKKEFGVFLYANIDFVIGRLDMPDQHLHENAEALVKALVPLRGPEFGPFINKCLMKVPGSNEEFVVDLQPFTPKVDLTKLVKKGRRKAAPEKAAPATAEPESSETQKEEEPKELAAAAS